MKGVRPQTADVDEYQEDKLKRRLHETWLGLQRYYVFISFNAVIEDYAILSYDGLLSLHGILVKFDLDYSRNSCSVPNL